MRRITLDVETSGLDPAVAAIIEVGGVVFENGAEVAQFSELCRPHASAMMGPHVDEALAVSGITRAEIVEARSSDVVSDEFGRWLCKCSSGASVHSFGVAFDSRFLACEPWMIRKDAWGECIMLAAMAVMYDTVGMPAGVHARRKWPKLAEASEFFGVGTVQVHRALPDARLAALVYEEILKRRGK